MRSTTASCAGVERAALGQLLEKVGAGQAAVRPGRSAIARLFAVGGDRGADLAAEPAHLRAVAEGMAQPAEAFGLLFERRLLAGVAAVDPVEERERPGARREAQQAGAGVEREQRLEDQGGVGVVHAALVAFVVALRPPAA